MATSSKAKKKTVRIASGRKRARQDVKLNAHNSALRSQFRTVIKNIQKVPACHPKQPSNELPDDCFEEAATPGELVRRLEQQLSQKESGHG